MKKILVAGIGWEFRSGSGKDRPQILVSLFNWIGPVRTDQVKAKTEIDGSSNYVRRSFDSCAGFFPG